MDIMSAQSRSDRRVRALEKNDFDMGASAPLRVVGRVRSIVQRRSPDDLAAALPGLDIRTTAIAGRGLCRPVWSLASVSLPDPLE